MGKSSACEKSQKAACDRQTVREKAMTTESLALFRGFSAKMHWMNQNQKVLSQNIANANTPDYRPQKLKDGEFERILKPIRRDPIVNPELTDAQHLTRNSISRITEAGQRQVYETAPDGNAVILEEQMMAIGQNAMDHRMISNLYRKNVGMLRMALHGNGR